MKASQISHKLKKYHQKMMEVGNDTYRQKHDFYLKKFVQIGGFKCPVCLRQGNEIKEENQNNRFVKLNPCRHILCNDCATEILRSNNKICPLDREQINTTHKFLDLNYTDEQYNNDEYILQEDTPLYAREEQQRVRERNERIDREITEKIRRFIASQRQEKEIRDLNSYQNFAYHRISQNQEFREHINVQNDHDNIAIITISRRDEFRDEYGPIQIRTDLGETIHLNLNSVIRFIQLRRGFQKIIYNIGDNRQIWRPVQNDNFELYLDPGTSSGVIVSRNQLMDTLNRVTE